MSSNGDAAENMSGAQDGVGEKRSGNGTMSNRSSPRFSSGVYDADPQLKELELSLQSYDWETLQERFAEAMEERTQDEMVLQRETADLLETTVLRDEDRAYKRFKTRMGFVQHSEMQLEDKKHHYANVVKAFESALALLRDE
ncbi:hypothetical protein KEM56_005760 [Ascosphaera pollenicola]|nr:hypothetical protein KEM56_005760 [Ascosphaera pollenicola]